MKKTPLAKAHSAFNDENESKQDEAAKIIKKVKKNSLPKKDPQIAKSASTVSPASAQKPRINVGLNVFPKSSSCEGTKILTSTVSSYEQMIRNRKLKQSVSESPRPHSSYERVSVEEFGAKIMQSLGWKKGYGVGRKQNEKEDTAGGTAEEKARLKSEKKGLGLDKSPSVIDAPSHSARVDSEKETSICCRNWIRDFYKVRIATKTAVLCNFFDKIATVVPGSVKPHQQSGMLVCSVCLDSSEVIDDVEEKFLRPHFDPGIPAAAVIDCNDTFKRGSILSFDPQRNVVRVLFNTETENQHIVELKPQQLCSVSK